MIATAIGPKNSLRMSGIIASTAAAAVSTIGRKRRTVASMIAFHGGWPAADVLVDLVDQDHRVAHDHAEQRDRAQHGDEAERLVEHEEAAATPIRPSGAVSSTISVREKLCSWIISSVTTTTGTAAPPA